MTQSDASEDFASAAAMRIVAMGLARQGLALPGPPPRGAFIRQQAKRDALDAVMSAHGPLALLRVADVLPHLPPEPLSQALLKARDIEDLLVRWHRLERFSHGGHEVVVKRAGKHAFSLLYLARNDGPQPSVAETLHVASALAILAEMVSGTTVTLGSDTGAVWRQHGQWTSGIEYRTRTWLTLAFRGPGRREAATPDTIGADVVDAMRRHMADDPIRRWTVADLAAATALSERTLQRRLADRAVSFSRLLADVRLQTAAHYLCDQSGPGLAEIAFLSGFADQAHFTRSFTSNVGTTPSAYRADFAV